MSDEAKITMQASVDVLNNAPESKRDMIASLVATYASGLADGYALAEQAKEAVADAIS